MNNYKFININQISISQITFQDKICIFKKEFAETFAAELRFLLRKEAMENPRLTPFLDLYVLSLERLEPELVEYNSIEAKSLLEHWTALYQEEVQIREDYEARVYRQGIIEDRKYSPYINPRYTAPIKKRKSENNQILVFRLPKILEYFWWKKDYDGTVIEWGKFYELILLTMYKLRDRLIDESDLKFRLLNEDKVHVPGQFYYIWEVRPKMTK